MKKPYKFTEDHIELLHTIEKDGRVSQRQIAKNTGLSIGKVNYIIKSLIEIGFVKINNFNKSNKKLEYAYILTPKGLKEKVDITKKFLIKKEQEYDKLNSYINK